MRFSIKQLLIATAAVAGWLCMLRLVFALDPELARTWVIIAVCTPFLGLGIPISEWLFPAEKPSNLNDLIWMVSLLWLVVAYLPFVCVGMIGALMYAAATENRWAVKRRARRPESIDYQI